MKKTNETWKQIPGTSEGNQCSNLGNFRFVDAKGNISELPSHYSTNKTKRHYRDVCIKNLDGKNFYVRASRALAKTFLDDTLPLKAFKGTKIVVNHIDNDPSNENIKNLEIVSQKQNIREARKFKQFGKTERKVWAEDENGNKTIYLSTSDLVEALTGTRNQGYFNHAVRYNHKIKGYKVGYVED